MTASPSQGKEPAGWFLQMVDGRSTVRVDSGLVLGEDERGEVELGPQGASPMVRFEIRDGGLWIATASRDWVLSSRERMLGDTLRVAESVVLRLPNNELRVLDSESSETAKKEVELMRRPSLSWLRPSRETGEGGPSEPEPGGERNEAAIGSGAGEPLGPEEQSDHVAPAGSVTAFLMERPVSERQYYTPDETVESRTSMVPPVAEPDLSVSARVSRARRTVNSGPSWPVTFAALALYLAGLVFSTPVQTPVLDEVGIEGGRTEHAEEDAFLGRVEELLRQQSPPDPTTLGFAVEAYRAASARRPADAHLRRRLAELESEMR